MKTLPLILLLIIFTICPLKAVDFPEIEGWKPVGNISTYNPETLYEYINGAADAYLAYGFQFLKTRDVSAEGVTVTVDIYDMGSPLNAFGIYKSERPKDQKVLAIGAEAVISPPYQCLLLKDSYYVKINVVDGEITETNGSAILKMLAKALPGECGFPKVITQLPADGKISGSDDFTRDGFLGISDLKNCVYAKYKEGEKEFFCFVILPGDEETNEVIWKKLAEKWKELEYKKQPVLYRKIPYKGICGVMLTNNKILGVTDCADEAELLRRLNAVVE